MGSALHMTPEQRLLPSGIIHEQQRERGRSHSRFAGDPVAVAVPVRPVRRIVLWNVPSPVLVRLGAVGVGPRGGDGGKTGAGDGDGSNDEQRANEHGDLT